MNRSYVACAVTSILAALGSVGFALGASSLFDVSQKGRTFLPTSVTMAVGDTLAIHNDDEFVHHIFVNSPDLKFDSGEQGIGQTAKITFPAPGTFRVLCAIHPKMRLDVVVK